MADSIKDKITVDSIKISDTELFYAKIGNGKKTLVILPGLNPKSLMPLAPLVAQLYSRFLDTYTVYMFDRVTNPHEGYTIQDMAKDTITAMDALQLKDIYMMGNSMGGMLAQQIAVDRSDLVKKVVFSSTVPTSRKKAGNSLSHGRKPASQKTA